LRAVDRRSKVDDKYLLLSKQLATLQKDSDSRLRTRQWR